MTSYYLEQHRPVRAQFRNPRRAQIRCVVVHTTEQAPDMVGDDHGTTAIASYIQRRGSAGSYHTVVDSDSTLKLIPPGWEAFGARGGWNKWSLHVSMCTKASRWATMPTTRYDGYLDQCAAVIAEWCQTYDIPATWITRAEGLAGARGITTHGSVDPGRRTDPGLDDAQLADLLRRIQSRMTKGDRVTADLVVDVLDLHSQTTIPGRVPFWSVLSNGRIISNNGAAILDDHVSKLDLQAPITGAHLTADGRGLILTAAGDAGTFGPLRPDG